MQNRAHLALFLTEQGEETFFTDLVEQTMQISRQFYPKYEIDAAFIRAMRMQPDPLLERVLRKKRIIQ